MGNDVREDTPPDDVGDDTADAEPDGGAPCEPQRTPAEFELEEISVNGSRVLIARPEGRPAGLMFVIHGTGGDARVFFDRVEAALFTHDALDRGLTIISPESINRGGQNGRGSKWEEDPTPDNPDILNILATVDRMHERGVPEDTPIYLAGGSNGGNFVASIAQQLEVVSAYIFISRAKAYRTEQDPVVPPTFFVEGLNDTTLPEAGPDLPLPYENYVYLRDRGFTVEHRYNPVAPVTPGRFTRIPGISCPQSIAVYRALGAHPGVLDEGDMLVEGWETTGWEDAMPPMAQPYVSDINDQLRELYSEHVPTAEFNDEVLDFLLGQ